MEKVEQNGSDYGLQIHWGKVVLVCVGCQQDVRAPSGDKIQQQESMFYLGSTINKDGKYGCELSRRIGSAAAEFNVLERRDFTLLVCVALHIGRIVWSERPFKFFL